MAAEVMTQPPAAGGGQMSEALQRFLRESDEAERASRASEDLHSADDASSEHAASLSEAKDFALDLKNLDISSRNISLQGLEEAVAQFADHEVLRAILEQGGDPRAFERQYDEQLRAAELESIQDYILESDNLAALHQQICACDEILAGMEGLLGRFQGDLGNISGEIRSLQEQSQTMSLRLRNRTAAEAKLAAFVQGLAVPPDLIDAILSNPVDETFREPLQALQKKLEFADTSSLARESAALRDVAPELERLRARAALKCREFLIQKVYNLRKPKTNIQILQQNVLLKHKHLALFLRRFAPEVSAEVRGAYVETLSRVLSGHFRVYLNSLESLQDNSISAGDVVGDAAPTGGMMAAAANLFARAGASGKRTDPFVLGDRAALLHHLDQAALIPRVAETEGRRFPIEMLFRSVNKLLMDTATTEYLFCCEFFQDDSVFSELFQATLTVVEGDLAAQLQECWDVVGVLLMVRINQMHRYIMSKRRIPALDGYLDRVNLLLWPRFKTLFDAVLANMKSQNAGPEPGKIHPLAQRYASLATSLLLLNVDAQDSQMVHCLDRLRYTAVDALIRLGNLAPKKRAGNIFLILNLTHIVGALREAGTQGGRGPAAPAESSMPADSAPSTSHPLGQVGADTQREFEDQLANCTSIYVEETLASHFTDLAGFVKRAEAAARRGGIQAGGQVPGYGPREAAPIVKHFSASWSNTMEALNKETMTDFKGSACGREVLKAALTQLLLYYTRMLDLIKGAGPEGAQLVKEAVTVPSIMYEIKRFNRT
ncbi:hypothetical protein WJX73_004682 [Symbiochloris irregularis]|uniref:Uncharacterized protein n=1 Tax=Symbiochloris irregularis TaxID=706552 RepID=A0AAW1NJX2_9CHLO